jgi:hypothetical protein
LVEGFWLAELIPLFLIIFYIMPFCVAAARAHHSAVPIMVVNLLLGWTVVGWFFAMGWALLGPAQTPQSRARDARRYERGPGETKAAMPRILHNFID